MPDTRRGSYIDGEVKPPSWWQDERDWKEWYEWHKKCQYCDIWIPTYDIDWHMARHHHTTTKVKKKPRK